MITLNKHAEVANRNNIRVTQRRNEPLNNTNDIKYSYGTQRQNEKQPNVDFYGSNSAHSTYDTRSGREDYRFDLDQINPIIRKLSGNKPC